MENNKESKVFTFRKILNPLEWDEYKEKIKNECYRYMWNKIFGKYTEVHYVRYLTSDGPCELKNGGIVTIDDANLIFDSEMMVYRDFYIPSENLLISIMRKTESKSRSGINRDDLNWMLYNETVTIETKKMVEDQDGNLQFKGEKKDMESKSNLQDSGNRREFEGGAVRDICEGKGRCDLLPLNEIVTLLYGVDKDSVLGKTLANIDGFLSTGDHEHLYCAMHEFILYVYGSEPNGILELAVHFEDGAKKYKEWNWQKGIPAHSYLDSAIRHLLKFHRGDTDERHDRAFLWNITCLLWTLNNKHDLDDIHYYFYDNNKAKR